MLRVAYLSLYNAVCFAGWAYILFQVTIRVFVSCRPAHLLVAPFATVWQVYEPLIRSSADGDARGGRADH